MIHYKKKNQQTVPDKGVMADLLNKDFRITLKMLKELNEKKMKKG